MTERETQVVTLLRMRHDWLPGPRTWTGSLVARSAQRGEVRETWAECPRCGGRREIGKGKAARRCERCSGHGRVKVDPYIDSKSKQALERERVTGETETAKLRRQRVDRELHRLELQEMHRKSSYSNSETEGWERAKQALYRSGSFAELDRALKVIEHRSAYDRAALEIVYGYDSPLREIGKQLQASADRAVSEVARLMPAEIRVPATEQGTNGTGRWANGAAQQKRDREIWRLHVQDGLNAAQIGRRLGVDRSTVGRVLRPVKERAA